MNRTVTVIILCVVAAAAAHANDFTWTGTAGTRWSNAQNWSGAGGFPGDDGRCGDRALIDAGGGAPEKIVFSSSSGDPTFGLDLRAACALMLDAANFTQPIELLVRGDILKVDDVFAVTGTTTVEISVAKGTLEVQTLHVDATDGGMMTIDYDSGVFNLDTLEYVGVSFNPDGLFLDLEEEFDVRRTVLQGDATINVADCAAFDAGRLTIIGVSPYTVITKTGPGMMHSS